MSEQEKIDLLRTITESNSSKLWTASIKQKIFKQYQSDKIFLNKVKQAFVNQQLIEVNSDPLEDKVVDDDGMLLASREWTCNARNCFYRFYRGNAPQLKIAPKAEDCKNLIGPKKFVCLKHYRVVNQKIDFCHNYFKLYKKLPQDAILNITKIDALVVDTQPSISAATNFDESCAFTSQGTETETVEVHGPSLDVEVTTAVSQGEFKLKNNKETSL